MSIEILNNGASLKIIRDGTSRLVLKQQIKEVGVSGTNLKIETCGCGSSCLFFPFAEVTNPVTSNPTALRDAVNVMLNSTIEGGSLTIEGFSTEQKQTEELARLQELKTTLQDASLQIQEAINNGFVGKATESRQLETLTKLDTITSQLLDGLAGISVGGGGEGSATDASVLLVKLAVETLTATLPTMLATLKSGLATESKQQVIVESLTELYGQLNTLITQTAGQTTTLTTALSGKASESKQADMLTKLQEIKTATEDAGLFVTTKLEEKFEAPAATALRQDDQTTLLNHINESVTNLYTTLQTLNADLNNGLSGKSTATLQLSIVGGLDNIIGLIDEQTGTLNSTIQNGLSGKATEQKQTESIVKFGEIKDVLLGMQVILANEIQSGFDGKSTEVKQNQTINGLTEVKTSITDLNTSLLSSIATNLNGKATEAKQTDTLTRLQEIKAAVEDVANFINSKLDAVMTGNATAARQDTQLIELQTITQGLDNLRTDIQNAISYDYRFQEPLRTETIGNIIYKGFAAAGTDSADSLWAIQRITNLGDGNSSVAWAFGNRSFIHIWQEHSGLPYQ